MAIYSTALKKVINISLNPVLLLQKLNSMNNNIKIRRLKGIHKGETAILIGNGPSVKFEDLNRLSNYVTFACNRFHLCYDDTTFRPTYTISADPQMIRDFGAEIEEKSWGKVFLCSPAYRKPTKDTSIHLKLNGNAPWFNSPTKGINPSGATLIVAMQIAYYMGINKFILYGVDHKFSFQQNKSKTSILDSAIGGENHFIPNYRSNKPWCPPATDAIEQGFKECARFLEQQDGSILNASRLSQLPFIERVDFDSIF
ncbi:MAG: DUF115 domain-containing protein [Thiocapsa sp.]|uniref:6-hydroxymethylpterin diphosphokinase MptE-like protein n=1 Tax=Thiocapsa sp. TaxID=2024551 RepID=UPI001BCD1A85|nr:6-hydroxymethylpterin diphosphokinase MptE-like protein [Thiocapsa sp.]QVL50104.1 MAG: DUF115 domain-containing protein [Thiocapsa sp.]